MKSGSHNREKNKIAIKRSGARNPIPYIKLEASDLLIIKKKNLIITTVVMRILIPRKYLVLLRKESVIAKTDHSLIITR